MVRLLLLLIVATEAHAQAIDIETAATVYQEAQIRDQVRAALPTMPGQMRKMFEDDPSARMSDPQLAAVTAAAKRGFRLDVFEAPALSALAAHLDPNAVKKIEAFLEGDVGKRMVAADVALATLPQAQIDQIMAGEISAPSTPQRDAIFAKLGRAAQTTESTVQIFLSMGTAVAVGTAVGSGMDPAAARQRAHQSSEAGRQALTNDMREPLRRYMAYGYRDLSDADLKRILGFLESPPGKRYVGAYIAAMNAGFDAMGTRCGEQLGESLRELAQARLAGGDGPSAAGGDPGNDNIPPDLKAPPTPPGP